MSARSAAAADLMSSYISLIPTGLAALALTQRIKLREARAVREPNARIWAMVPLEIRNDLERRANS